MHSEKKFQAKTKLIENLANAIKNTSLTTKILSGIAIPIILMSIVSSLVYNSINSLIETSNWVNKTQDVITKGHILEKLVLDMETSERGFLITGKEKYLEPFIRSREIWDNEIKKTKLLISDDLEQIEKIELIDQQAKEWLKLAANPEIAERRKVSPALISIDQIEVLLQKKIGKRILDNMQELTNKINSEFVRTGNQTASNLLVSISKDIVDQEAAERGFLITGDEEFLKPYYEGISQFKIHISKLKSLILSTPNRNKVDSLISQIESLAYSWESTAAQPEIDIRRGISNNQSAKTEEEKQFRDLSKLLGRGYGKEILEQLREILERLNELYVRSNNEKVQLLIAIISKSIIDRETGQRGFLISGDESFLVSYIEGKQVFDTNLEKIKNIAVNAFNKEKVYAMVENLELLLATWHESAANVEINARREINRSGLSSMELIQRMQRIVLENEYLLEVTDIVEEINTNFKSNSNTKGKLNITELNNALLKLKGMFLQFMVDGYQQQSVRFNHLRGKLFNQLISFSIYLSQQPNSNQNALLKGKLASLKNNLSLWFTDAVEPALYARMNVQKSRSSTLAQIQQVLKQGKGTVILNDIRKSIVSINKKFIENKNTIASNLVLRIGKAIVDQETGERGYIITGEDVFLEPYRIGTKDLSLAISELRNVVQQTFDVEETYKKLDVIESEVNRWLNKSAEPEIEQRKLVNLRKQKYTDIIKTIRQRKGKKILDNILELQNELSLIFKKAKHSSAQRLVLLISRSIVEMETGLRGFLLTGKQGFLQPYEKGKQTILTLFKEIREIVNAGYDVNTMLFEVERLRTKAELWKEKAGEPEIKLRQQLDQSGSSMKDVTRLIENETGKKLIDSLRKKISQFIHYEKEFVKVREAESKKVAAATLYQTVFGTLTAILIALISAFLVLRMIIESLNRLSHATDKVARGDYNAKIKINSKDEIGKLANSFNEMINQLAKSNEKTIFSQNKLKRQTERLEAKNALLLNTQNELKLKADELEQTSQYKSNFLATMSHEIRTPMNGILGMLGLLQNTSLNSDQQRKISIAKSSADSLLSIINEILDFSKIESGKLELESLDFNLRGMIGDFTESMAFRAQEKGLEIVLNVTEIEQSMVKGDAGRIRQILVNLVGNAIKFTTEGEIVIHAKTEKVKENRLKFICCIDDTGIGISEEKLDKLFEAFTQEDSSTTREYGGTGLGLTISKRLCELMGGKITVTSHLGQGSRFKFELLLTISQRSQLVAPRVDISRLHLLVVDDNTTNRTVLRGQLEYWGATVSESDSADRALIMCNERFSLGKKLYDVAFIDMQMPNTNGAELAQQIRSDNRLDSIKLIMMASISHTEEPQYFADLGLSAYFAKPTTTSDICDSLNAVVDGGDGLNQAAPLATHNYLNSLLHKNEYSQLWPKNSRLLLVEDNHINQQVGVGILSEFGLHADVAANGVEALQMLQNSHGTTPYSLIFMDCQMPEMDGYEASRLIRKGVGGYQYRPVPIIAMTANVMMGDKEKCLDAGMSDYLSKPVEPSQIAEMLTRWLLQDSKAEITNNMLPVVNDYSPPKNDNNLKIWDRAALFSRMSGKQERIIELIQLFLDTATERKNQLKLFNLMNDVKQLEVLAHSIKGASSSVSANELAEKAAAIEIACRKDKQENMVQMVAELLIAYNEVEALFLNFQSEIKNE